MIRVKLNKSQLSKTIEKLEKLITSGLAPDISEMPRNEPTTLSGREILREYIAVAEWAMYFLKKAQEHYQYTPDGETIIEGEEHLGATACLTPSIEGFNKVGISASLESMYENQAEALIFMNYLKNYNPIVYRDQGSLEQGLKIFTGFLLRENIEAMDSFQKIQFHCNKDGMQLVLDNDGHKLVLNTPPDFFIAPVKETMDDEIATLKTMRDWLGSAGEHYYSIEWFYQAARIRNSIFRQKKSNPLFDLLTNNASEIADAFPILPELTEKSSAPKGIENVIGSFKQKVLVSLFKELPSEHQHQLLKKLTDLVNSAQAGSHQIVLSDFSGKPPIVISSPEDIDKLPEELSFLAEPLLEKFKNLQKPPTEDDEDTDL